VISTSVARGEDVSWTSSVSLWKSLTPNGQLVDAGPAPSWGSPPPAATIGRLPPMPRPAPEGTPRPRALPEDLVQPGPSLPPFEVATTPGEPPAPQVNELFAADRPASATSQIKQTRSTTKRLGGKPSFSIFIPAR
jgi:hypothetical protein